VKVVSRCKLLAHLLAVVKAYRAGRLETENWTRPETERRAAFAKVRVYALEN
jgi:hypothetical protein